VLFRTDSAGQGIGTNGFRGLGTERARMIGEDEAKFKHLMSPMAQRQSNPYNPASFGDTT